MQFGDTTNAEFLVDPFAQGADSQRRDTKVRGDFPSALPVSESARNLLLALGELRWLESSCLRAIVQRVS
jgi:hypothetical protein